MVSWKAHLFPFSVVIPSMVVVILACAYVLGVHWNTGTVLAIGLLIIVGIWVYYITSKKIENLVFGKPEKTEVRRRKRKVRRIE